MSYSQFSTWEYNYRNKVGKEEWFDRYIKNKQTPPGPELKFGKKFGDSVEAGKPLAPVTMLSKMEQGFNVVMSGIKLVGYSDTFNKETLKETGEYKTGVRPWTQKLVDEHKQITFYALFNLITNKINPEDCKFWLEWVPTVRIDRANGDFSGDDYDIEFQQPTEVHHFDTKRTMKDITKLIRFITDTRKEMEIYARKRLALTE